MTQHTLRLKKEANSRLETRTTPPFFEFRVLSLLLPSSCLVVLVFLSTVGLVLGQGPARPVAVSTITRKVTAPTQSFVGSIMPTRLSKVGSAASGRPAAPATSPVRADRSFRCSNVRSHAAAR